MDAEVRSTPLHMTGSRLEWWLKVVKGPPSWPLPVKRADAVRAEPVVPLEPFPLLRLRRRRWPSTLPQPPSRPDAVPRAPRAPPASQPACALAALPSQLLPAAHLLAHAVDLAVVVAPHPHKVHLVGLNAVELG